MEKVLVVDHERRIRKWLTDSLGKCGYEVVEAANGQTALETASHQRIDLILLDDALPRMDGWQVLTKLKEDPQLQRIPVVILTSFPSADTEATGFRLGAAHVLSKPCHTEALETTVRVAIREAERNGGNAPIIEVEPEEALPPGLRNNSSSSNIIGTGGKLVPLEKVLRGGIPTGSLTLIEGSSGAGKSVICQYLLYGAVMDGLGVAYFSAQHTAGSLAQQMRSIGLNLLDNMGEDRLCVYPLQDRATGDDPDALLAELVSELQGVPTGCGLVIIDDITNLAQVSQDRAVMGFLSSCQRLCENGRTIVVVARPSAYNPNLLPRLHGLCSTHIGMVIEAVRDKMVTALEVSKISNSEPRSDNRLRFQVEPDIGVRIVPMSRVKF